MRFLLLFACLMAGTPAAAQTVLAARTVRSQTILTPGDLKLSEIQVPGAFSSLDEILGQEARVVLYAGRPIRIEDVGPPAIIERNQLVTLLYSRNGLTIATEARALSRAGVGDRIKVMNLASRSTITGTVRADGIISVSPAVLPSM